MANYQPETSTICFSVELSAKTIKSRKRLAAIPEANWEYNHMHYSHMQIKISIIAWKHELDIKLALGLTCSLLFKSASLAAISFSFLFGSSYPAHCTFQNQIVKLIKGEVELTYFYFVQRYIISGIMSVEIWPHWRKLRFWTWSILQ